MTNFLAKTKKLIDSISPYPFHRFYPEDEIYINQCREIIVKLMEIAEVSLKSLESAHKTIHASECYENSHSVICQQTQKAIDQVLKLGNEL